jgi:multiple sugar transport system ATP-binding protein
MNLVGARCDGERIAFAGHTLPLAGDFAGTRGDVVLGLRPGAFELAGPWTDPQLPRIEVEAEVVEALGDEALVSFRVDAPEVQVDDARTDEGRLLADDVATRFIARVRGRVDVHTGERLELAVDHHELHLFDPASGAALERSGSPAPTAG